MCQDVTLPFLVTLLTNDSTVILSTCASLFLDPKECEVSLNYVKISISIFFWTHGMIHRPTLENMGQWFYWVAVSRERDEISTQNQWSMLRTVLRQNIKTNAHPSIFPVHTPSEKKSLIIVFFCFVLSFNANILWICPSSVGGLSSKVGDPMIAVLLIEQS